jgi:hypothetical protein
MRKLFLAIVLAVSCGSATQAQSLTHTFTWTWTNARTSGAALALSAIGGFNLCDMSVPVPGGSCNGGTLVACPVTIPPTTTTGSCTANVIAGHNYVALELDNSVPPLAAGPSNTYTQAAPLAPPNPITDLR